MAICSILVSFLLLYGLTTITEVSPIVQFLVALIGLGVSIDYALLIVVRWREEREGGLEGDEAVAAAMATAGRAVVFSGTTVAVGLLALVALPLPFLRSMGYGGLLIPLVATLVAITLLPVVLATIGPRLDKRRIRRTRPQHALLAAVVGGDRAAPRPRRDHRRRASSRVLVVPATNLHLGNADPDTIAKAGPAKEGLTALEGLGHRHRARSRPIETLAPGGRRRRGRGRRGASVEGVHGAVAPEARRVARDGTARRRRGAARGRRVRGRPRHGAGASSTPRTRASPQARVGGSGPLNADFIDAVYGAFPLMIALISILTFLLLARAFRSLLLPLKAVILNILSVGAAWGVMTLVWQEGHGSDELWGIAATGSIASWIPLMVFAFLYGLSMDYEVFILARMREEYDKTGETDTGGGLRPGPHRPARHERRADPVPRLRRDGVGAGDRREDPRDRPGGGHPARRDRRSARCSCPRWCRCSGSGTGGCRRPPRGCCASRRRPSRSPAA